MNRSAEGRPRPGGDPWVFEKMALAGGHGRVAGIDEAGRGPLAGPVVAAAVILPETFDPGGVTDSKKLTPAGRERLYDYVYDRAVAVGIGIVDAVEIDRINILQASLLAMALATENLHPASEYLLIDGTFEIAFDLPQRAIPGGDALSVSIGAASIVAKVTRDRLMVRYDQDFPQFGFARHKGYPTRAHRDAIRRHGCCPIHRKTFRGVLERPVQTSLFGR